MDGWIYAMVAKGVRWMIGALGLVALGGWGLVDWDSDVSELMCLVTYLVLGLRLAVDVDGQGMSFRGVWALA